jgi:phosphoglycolate phosphatase-like HAD superfamily hydrolase
MYKIYCDLDGVLADFEKGYAELTNTLPSKTFNGKAEFWEPINKAGAEFWANLDWMPDGQELWRYIKKYKPNILSAPSSDLSSKIGKEAWVKMHLKNNYNKLYLYSRANKQLFSEPNRILIDYMKKTIDEWNDKGGIGIFHTSAANTIKELKKLGL